MKKTTCSFVVFLFVTGLFPLFGQVSLEFDRYHSPEQVEQLITGLSGSHPEIVRLHRIGVTPGGRSVTIVEIRAIDQREGEKFPSVLVAANMQGTAPISTEAALYLLSSLINDSEARTAKVWYVLPCGNPDAATNYFAKPQHFDPRNRRPHNDDLDDQQDEDGPNDLNGDGVISLMRVEDPKGEWIPVPGEPRLMKKADSFKGEKGLYKIHSEGIDDDGDGEYNEDGAGGVNIGINFPHLFPHGTEGSGPWAGSEEESHSLLRFIFDRPEIAMVFTFGSSNFCLKPPEGGRKGSVDLQNIQIPERIGQRFGIDTTRTYTMAEIKEMMQPYVPPGMELTESMIASFLGLGAVVNPLPEDLKFYEELSEQYKEYLKEKGLDGKRIPPESAKDGSFELWSYYHLGLPSFALDFWTAPEAKSDEEAKPEITVEQLEQMTNEEFIALGEEKIDSFLKSVNSPGNFSAQQVIGALQGGMMTTKRMAELLRNRPSPPSKEGADPKEKSLLTFSDTNWEGRGFVEWSPIDHPTLGSVEVGGFMPYLHNSPPENMLRELLEAQVPWVLEIAGKMARIRIARTESEGLGSGLYQIKVWVENVGYLPYPTAMGSRNNRIVPVVVTLEGEQIQFMEGKSRSLIKSINGHSAELVRWIVRVSDPSSLRVIATTPTAWSDEKTIEIGGNR